MQARLLLQDGTLFTGTAFGAEGEKTGEVVFNTGITGYQEVLSDPSYCGQIVTMTYPLIGNYGITRDDFESVRPFVHGFVVRRHEEVPSNWRAEYSVDDLLKEYDIPGISEIDTRMLTRIIRHYGTMKAILTTSNKRVEELMEMMGNTTIEELRNQVARTSTASSYSSPGNKERIVLVDYGAKAGILRELNDRGCDVVVVPHDVKAEEVRRLNPDGILLSNGPGDPKDVPSCCQDDFRIAWRISDLRYLPRSSVVCTGLRSRYREAEIRSPRWEPPCEGTGKRTLLHHFPEPWLYRQ